MACSDRWKNFHSVSWAEGTLAKTIIFNLKVIMFKLHVFIKTLWFLFVFYLQNQANVITSIHMENLDKSPKMPSEIMEEIISSFKIPENKQVLEYSSFLLLQDQCYVLCDYLHYIFHWAIVFFYTYIPL